MFTWKNCFIRPMLFSKRENPYRTFAPSQLRLSLRSVAEGKMVMTEWEGHRQLCNRFPGICRTTEENPGKPQLGNRRGHLVTWPVIASLQIKSVEPHNLLRYLNPFGSGRVACSKIEIWDPKIRSLEFPSWAHLKNSLKFTTGLIPVAARSWFNTVGPSIF